MTHVTFSFYLVYCEDSFGNDFTAVVNDPSDNLHVCGLIAADGANFSFESEAYHLRYACTPESGIKYWIKTQELTSAVKF